MKKQLYLYIFLLAVIIVAMVAVRNYSSDKEEVTHRDLPEIRQEGILRMAADYNSVELHAQADSMAGFQYELARAFSDFTGVEIEIYPVSSIEESLDGLNANKYDIVARLIPVTVQLKEQFNASKPFVTSKHVLVQRLPEGDNDSLLIRNQLYLAGKELHIAKNSSVYTRLANLMKEIGDTIYVVEDPLYQDEQLIQMVSMNLIDYAVVDEHIAKRIQADYPNVDIKTDISFAQLNSWITRKDSPVLMDSINSFVEQFKNSNKFKELKKHYLR
ncbi:MAG: transporter substrate-binding domain-containing protein [Bacteroidales bacterium]